MQRQRKRRAAEHLCRAGCGSTQHPVVKWGPDCHCRKKHKSLAASPVPQTPLPSSSERSSPSSSFHSSPGSASIPSPYIPTPYTVPYGYDNTLFDTPLASPSDLDIGGLESVLNAAAHTADSMHYSFTPPPQTLHSNIEYDYSTSFHHSALSMATPSEFNMDDFIHGTSPVQPFSPSDSPPHGTTLDVPVTTIPAEYCNYPDYEGLQQCEPIPQSQELNNEGGDQEIADEGDGEVEEGGEGEKGVEDEVSGADADAAVPKEATETQRKISKTKAKQIASIHRAGCASKRSLTKRYSEGSARLLTCAQKLNASTSPYLLLFVARPESINTTQGTVKAYVSPLLQSAYELQGGSAKHILKEVHRVANEHAHGGVSTNSARELNETVRALQERNEHLQQEMAAMRQAAAADAQRVEEQLAELRFASERRESAAAATVAALEPYDMYNGTAAPTLSLEEENDLDRTMASLGLINM
ncbi:hypothetical protein BXZ70DRAFT_914257 [Cristinia sonorae]|uniref:Uncharacterized protein n=1 Tax=Cristinia sonorae TaxID=1940300 RepID=A0A8K0UZ42_9AGAR|nr:hypothetical protein BXZ70DRAFT_916873 [Cristinia sonorae]KAH8108112.1 hypothetical protein BXZ70DRAFT_914257 [Cristinia sonorae]